MLQDTTYPTHEIDAIRRLADRVAAIAADPVNLERKRLWYAHDAGTGARPMVLAEVGGIRDQRNPLRQDELVCHDPFLRGLEWHLQSQVYQFDELQDDHVVEPVINVNWQVRISDFGVHGVEHSSSSDVSLASKSWDPPISDIDRDFAKLTPRTYAVDREASEADLARHQAIFDDILPVRRRGYFWWSFTPPMMPLLGLEGLMLAMYDNPEGVHRIMGFLRDEQVRLGRWLEAEGLLGLNNENDYIGSGSVGYTRDLPQADAPAGGPVRLADQWVLHESQETVCVSPEQYEEFIFPYELSMAAMFGKCYYGCCEPVSSRWHVLSRLPNLARVSVSPWADEAVMAEAVGTRIVYCRKPNPALISTEIFDEEAIRADLRHTLTAAQGCRLELVMKDVHTLNNEPWRLARWVAIAYEEIARMA